MVELKNLELCKLIAKYDLDEISFTQFHEELERRINYANCEVSDE